MYGFGWRLRVWVMLRHDSINRLDCQVSMSSLRLRSFMKQVDF